MLFCLVLLSNYYVGARRTVKTRMVQLTLTIDLGLFIVVLIAVIQARCGWIEDSLGNLAIIGPHHHQGNIISCAMLERALE